MSTRVGVAVDTLRAWERRYGLLDPQRSPGGFRLYSGRDESLVRAMVAEIDRGFAPAQAARLALAAATGANADETDQRTGISPASVAREDLLQRLLGYDGRAAHEILDAALARYGVDVLLEQVVLPCLRDIGSGWEASRVSVPQEHFASALLRERLLGLARDWDRGLGPRAVLACPPQERHDIGLICFGLALNRAGWRITFLGADTPVADLARACERIRPDLVVLAAMNPERFIASRQPVRALAKRFPVALCGPGATAGIGGRRLTGTPSAAAAEVAAARRAQ